MQYDNSNSGILTRNLEKKQPNQPDYRGTINVDGVDYWLSGWVKEGKAGGKLEGQKFFSLSVSPKQQQAAPRSAQAKQAPSVVDTDGFDDLSDLPF